MTHLVIQFKNIQIFDEDYEFGLQDVIFKGFTVGSSLAMVGFTHNNILSLALFVLRIQH